MNLIGDDFQLSYRISSNDARGGATPSFGGSVSMTTQGSATFRNARFRSRIQTTNVMGGGDLAVRNRYHSQEDEVEIEGMVPQSGPQFYTYRGRYMEYTFTPYSPDAPTFTGIGVITEAEYEAQQGDAQSETVTLDLNPDYAT